VWDTLESSLAMDETAPLVDHNTSHHEEPATCDDPRAEIESQHAAQNMEVPQRQIWFMFPGLALG